MKKIFTLMTLCMLSFAAWAAVGDKYEIILNGKNAVKFNGEDMADFSSFYTYNSAKHSFNSKFTGCSYAGVEFKSGLKMEGATLVQFTATSESTITIVQSNWSNKTIKFDDEELDINSATTITNGIVYTLTGVAPGTHKVTRGSGEAGVFYVSVEYTGEAKTQLTAPEFTINKANGEVTIASVANATEIRYTTDGKNPGAEVGEVYSAPFVVADGTTVKAVAIGTGSYINSAIADTLVLVDGIIVANPVIKQQNGTVYIKSETIGSQIEYSTDQANWIEVSRAFTLNASAIVYARAKRENCTTSDIVNAQIDVKAAPTNTKKVVFYSDTPSGTWTADEMNWTGCTENEMYADPTNDPGEDYAGIKLAITGNTDKKWSAGSWVVVPGVEIPYVEDIKGDSVMSLKVSNGAQNTITLAEGQKAVRLTFYSYVNAASNTFNPAKAAGWKEVYGVDYDVNEVPMGAYVDLRDCGSNPDVRVYDLDFVQGSITFTNANQQLAFVAVLELATPETVTGIKNMNTEVSNGIVYNVAGQKVNAGFKGLAIKNGKKVIMK